MISIITACNEESVSPGLYIKNDLIETFPGDTVLIEGTISNYDGLSSLKFNCNNWKIEKKYDLSNQKPKVFNYSYRMAVPEDASFPEYLDIEVTDVNNVVKSEKILVKYIPDTQAPICSNAPKEQTSVDFNSDESKGIWNLNLKIEDDRMIDKVNIIIEKISFNKTFDISAKNTSINESIEFSAAGSYPTAITMTDKSGNFNELKTEVIVMVEETEDPISNYPFMYIINAEENPNDYLHGYYNPMKDHGGEYQYGGYFYAPKDNTKIFFVPTKDLNGDKYGVSPYVSSKLMNKNGYVDPVTIAKSGYYYIYIDLQAHSYEIKEETPVPEYTGDLYITGVGFTTFADWNLHSTTKNGNIYEVELKQDATDNTHSYCFICNDQWSQAYRYWDDGKGCGWWFSKDGAGNGEASYTTDYQGGVKITFDSAIPWATVKKVNTEE